MTQAYVNPFKSRQLKEYGEEGLKYLLESELLSKYVARKGTASTNSAETIRSRLNRFGFFIFKKFPGIPNLDTFLSNAKKGVVDPYDLLAEYASWLTEKGTKANQIRQLVRSAKQFLRHKIVGVQIDNDDFRENVSLPRQEFPDFEGTEKPQIVELLTACKNQRLKTALMLYAVRGPRAIEGCALRHMDVDYEKETITIRPEFEKLRRQRTRPMTRELKAQLQMWEKIKYQPHYVVNGKQRTFVTPKPKPEDLVLAYWHPVKNPKPSGIYDTLTHEYQALADLLNMERKNGRRVITFHRLRAFAKTTISNLGFPDYANWWIGHGTDTYYRNSKQETINVFKKVEGALTFLDIGRFEADGADMQSKLKVQEDLNRDLQKQLEDMKAESDARWQIFLQSQKESKERGMKFKENAMQRLKIEKE